jgi:hypothetical protein
MKHKNASISIPAPDDIKVRGMVGGKCKQIECPDWDSRHISSLGTSGAFSRFTPSGWGKRKYGHIYSATKLLGLFSLLAKKFPEILTIHAYFKNEQK